MNAERETACSFTGHSELPVERVEHLRDALRSIIERLYTERHITTYYAGGAQGFDALASEAVIECRFVLPDLRLVVVVPHDEQAKRWSADEQARYEHIKSEANEVISLAPHYFRGCMQKRNRYMVDHSAVCVCYLTEPSGGTAYTVNYASKCGLIVFNLAEAAEA